MRWYIKIISFAFYLLLIVSCTTVEKKVSLGSYLSVDSLFKAENYIKDSTVSKLFVQNFDESIRELDTEIRKDIFINSMLSNILAVNEDITSLREELDSLKKAFQDKSLSSKDQKKLKKLFKSYRCKQGDFSCLNSKVNIFPPSLILAQAIVESGWGTSRFAIEANSVFGEHFSNGAEGEFIQASGSDIKLRSFPSIKASVESYCLNLNRHRAYRSLREKRNEMMQNKVLDSYVLCEELKSYSELGEEYVEVLRGIIQSNSLQKYDELSLDKNGEILKVSIE